MKLKKLVSKFPRVHFGKKQFKDDKGSRSLLPVGVALMAFLLIILIIWLVAPYTDGVYALIPGYYQIERYNEVTEEKNTINEENIDLYTELLELETQYNDVPATEEGYTQMVQIDNDIITTLEDIEVQLTRSRELNDELKSMRLPEVVSQYVQLSIDLDDIQYEVNEQSLQVSAARRDLNELRLLRSTFDNCLLEINWTSSEKTISDAITACNATIPALQEKVGSMEIEYGAHLDQMSGYLVLLKEEWEAEAAYYFSLSERNYTQANQYDTVFVERKRQISELDIIAVFNEFTLETLGPMQENLISLKEKAAAKEKTATQWFENNIQR